MTGDIKNMASSVRARYKPRIILLSEEIDKYLCLPRGCEKDLNI